MAGCFSKGNVYAVPVVYVLSQIPRLAECLIDSALPGVQIKSVELPSEFDKNLHLTEKQIEEVKNAEIIVCDKFILKNSYQELRNLKWAHCTWAGLEELFEAIPEEPNFIVTRHAGEAFSQIMAEYVLCQILNHERGNKAHWRNQQAKQWQRQNRFETFRSLNEITVGILGVGNMGNGIAKFLKPFGTTLLGLARRPRSFSQDYYFTSISTELKDIISQCDYIINTLPSTADTKGLLNDSKLEMCLKKPVFINVGRGDIISEYELLLAFRREQISAAVLDVFEDEPLPTTSALWEMPQVTITPHVAAVSKPEHIAEEFFSVFRSYISGHGLKNCVNWRHGY